MNFIKPAYSYFVLAISLTSICFCDTLAQAEPIDPASIPESAYVVVKDGHLTINGERQRFWAATDKTYARSSGIKPEDSAEVQAQKTAAAYASTDRILDHMQAAGFNAVRLWAGNIDGIQYERGDGSKADLADYFLAELKRRGMRVWSAGMNRIDGVVPEDVDVLDLPETREAWMEAVAEGIAKDTNKRKKVGHHFYSGWALDKNPAIFWDPRLEAMTLKRKTEVVTHFNHHTSLRWCDDPVFAVWELSNEEWWVRQMVGGKWQRLPAFFRQSLIQRWHRHLIDKYGDHDALVAAWGGVLPNERLDEGTVLFAPMANPTLTSAAINDSSPAAQAAVLALDQKYNPDDFPEARGRDVLEFLVQMHLSHKQRLADAIKPLGRGTTLSPMIFDTGIGYEIQSLWMHQQADAVTFCAYVNGYGPTMEEWNASRADSKWARDASPKRASLEAERIVANDGPWVNWLLKPPGISSGVPWLETGRVEGKPFLVYETQIQQPGKYRADFPLRIAALASTQDWDWVTWHYFGDGRMNRASSFEKPFEHPMDVTTARHPQGYHLTYDEVQQSLMRAAAYLFRNHAWEKATNPTTFVFGRKALYDPDSMVYGGSFGDIGMDMLQTVYEYGSRIKVDPSRDDNVVIGPVIPFEARNTHNPYLPTDQITFDHKEGLFRAVAPGGVAYAGRVEAGSELQLGDVTFSDLRVHNPEGIYDPVDEDNPYLALSVYTRDGKPLAESSQAGISIASTSFNTGFDLSRVELYRAKGTKGELPVLVARPSATIRVPGFAGGTYTVFDFHGGVVAEGKVSDEGTVVLKHTQPAWFIDLRR